MKSNLELLDTVIELNKLFEKLSNYNFQDWQDLELTAEENLSEKELKRFDRMLVRQIFKIN